MAQLVGKGVRNLRHVVVGAHKDLDAAMRPARKSEKPGTTGVELDGPPQLTPRVVDELERRLADRSGPVLRRCRGCAHCGQQQDQNGNDAYRDHGAHGAPQ